MINCWIFANVTGKATQRISFLLKSNRLLETSKTYQHFTPSIHWIIALYLSWIPDSCQIHDLQIFSSIQWVVISPFFFKILFIFSWETQRERGREKQAPCREPDVGLDPRTPGSRLEPKADAQPLNHPGAPHFTFLILSFDAQDFKFWLNPICLFFLLLLIFGIILKISIPNPRISRSIPMF